MGGPRRHGRAPKYVKDCVLRVYRNPPGTWISALFPACVPVLPQLPAVYILYGGEPEVPIYIGQSINLNKRCYFHERTFTDAEVIEFACILDSDDRMLLERTLIRRHSPVHNVQFND